MIVDSQLSLLAIISQKDGKLILEPCMLMTLSKLVILFLTKLISTEGVFICAVSLKAKWSFIIDVISSSIWDVFVIADESYFIKF